MSDEFDAAFDDVRSVFTRGMTIFGFSTALLQEEETSRVLFTMESAAFSREEVESFGILRSILFLHPKESLQFVVFDRGKFPRRSHH